MRTSTQITIDPGMFCSSATPTISGEDCIVSVYTEHCILMLTGKPEDVIALGNELVKGAEAVRSAKERKQNAEMCEVLKVPA